MIYLDNAATSRFKPQCAINALLYDVNHSVNANRSAHKECIDASLKIEECRQFLLNSLKCDERYNLIFTKSCTEALNLAIFGLIKGGERVVTTNAEHNAILRPLYYLKSINKISLTVINNNLGSISINEIKKLAKENDIFIFSYAQNVSGSYIDLEDVSKAIKGENKTLIVDCAQSIPILDIDVSTWNIDMIACSAHKGLHGIQGVGFLIVKDDIRLSPLIYGGNGSHSTNVLPPIEIPQSYEVGTMFSGGISALYQSAKWSFDNLISTRKTIKRLASELASNLKNIRATIYNHDYTCGIVAFNINGYDSTYIADALDEYDVCIRAGFHCAPFIHNTLHTSTQGVIRASLGCDNSRRDIISLLVALEKIIK